MTPPARPDRVAAALDAAWVASNDAHGMGRPPDLAGHLRAALAEAGYVLVNADMLARAVRSLYTAGNYLTGYPETDAAAILAALEKQP